LSHWALLSVAEITGLVIEINGLFRLRLNRASAIRQSLPLVQAHYFQILPAATSVRFSAQADSSAKAGSLMNRINRSAGSSGNFSGNRSPLRRRCSNFSQAAWI
jgi:hypothetical protein